MAASSVESWAILPFPFLRLFLSDFSFGGDTTVDV
jgi:hypothetical protein